MEPIVKIENLSVIYDIGKASETKALSDVNIEVYPEEYVVFFGPSGCGKSTLLYAIAAMEKPTIGSIFVNGNNLHKMNEKEITQYRRESIGMVFQQYNLIPSLNVSNNVAIPQTFKSVEPEERLGKAQELLDRFGIGAFSMRLPGELSGGQQQRVSVCRALINNTPIILADEPTGNLDSKATQNVLDIFQELNNRDKKTIILVTHDPNQLQYAHRVFHMKDGKVIQQTINQQKSQKIDSQTREQLAKSITESSAIEEILSVYPELTESRLKSKAIVNYLLSDLSTQQLDRLERLVEDRILGKISKEDFHIALDIPIENGGAGLNYQSVKQIGNSIELLLSETDSIQKNMSAGKEDNKAMEAVIKEIKSQLLSVVPSVLDEQQIERLEECIKKRIKGEIDRKDFFASLDNSSSHGGVGLRREVALHLSRRMEILLVKFKDFAE